MIITEEQFLEAELANGVGFHSQLFINLCNITASMFDDFTDIKTVLDYGSGTSVYAKAFQDKGYDVYCYEIFKVHRDYALKHAPDLKFIDTIFTTDLLLWIETAEHMRDDEIKFVFDSIKPKYVLFSSTSQRTPMDVLWSHINIKEQHEWIKLFESNSYEFVKDTFNPTQWSKFFKLK